MSSSSLFDPMPSIPTILVTGDIVLDHHIYEGERQHFLDPTSRGARIVRELGGAAFTHRLISGALWLDHERHQADWERKRSAAAEENKPFDQPAPVPPTVVLAGEHADPASDPEQFPDELKCYALWRAVSKNGGRDTVWRVVRSLGYGANETGGASAQAQPSPETTQVPPPSPTPTPDILVLDDAGQRFRHLTHQHLWQLPAGHPALSPTDSLPRWIVLKLGGPIGHSPLWSRLHESGALRRSVVVVSADVLRRAEIRLPLPLSWEHVAGQLISELAGNPALQPLRQCAHLIVSFKHDGAIWIDFSGSEPSALLAFDPAHTEGEWSERMAGDAFGYTSCLTAAVVRELATTGAGRSPDFSHAMECGLSAMRRLRASGHGPAAHPDGSPIPGGGIPAGDLAQDLVKPTAAFARARVPWGGEEVRHAWSILAASQGPAAAGRPLLGFARQIALRGEAALRGVPHLRIGQLLTASREEMESLRLLRSLLLNFKTATNRNTKPLSIGVFGAPGAGKSFGVRELATGIFGEPGARAYEGWMEFNLSQFSSPNDLIGAFHQVRDRVLQGFVPVVFWDEFDAENCRWLQYLLAPMQDGRFQEGQIIHPVGRCVFIFAGATSSTFESFGPNAHDAEAVKHFKLVKGPDFKSRLDAYLNVLGPNPAGPADTGDPANVTAPRPPPSPATGDIFGPVRRAILIRALLGCGPLDRLDIDQGVLTALLEIDRFAHGARSLEKLLEPLKVARKSGLPVQRSLLGADARLSLYLDPVKFDALCRRNDGFLRDEVISVLAPAIHEAWRKIARTQGWPPKYDRAFAALPPDIRRSNEAAARRMVDHLALVGLRLVNGLAADEEEATVRRHLALHLELLAEAEHEGWMTHLLDQGWRYDENRKDESLRHNCLLPYHELSEIDREKDRDSIRHYPDFAREAGWQIVFG